MTDKPKAYNLTQEHFARARADIARRRARLDVELAQIDAWESIAIDVVERYPADAASPAIGKPGYAASRKARRSKAGKPSNSGKPYTPEQDARIMASERGERAQLAQELGRDYDGLLKRHEVLLKQQRESEKTDTPVPDPTTEEPGSENSAIVEPTADRETTPPADVAGRDSAAARELAEFDGRLQRRPPAKPGIPVLGLTDDGRGKERFLDPVAFASKRPD